MANVSAPLGVFTALTRTPAVGKYSNYETPIQSTQITLQTGQPMQAYGWYEQTYFAGANLVPGPQEWITVPDCGKIGVMLSFPGNGGSASVEFTCSPPSVVMGTVDPNAGYRILNASQQALYPGWPVISAPVWKAWDAGTLLDDGEYNGVVTVTTFRVLQCITALRLNLIGGACTLSIRCA